MNHPVVRHRVVRHRVVLHRIASQVFALRERLLPRPRRFVLILGHMRSGSSLLNHLLLQHPLICGAGERNATYRDRRDLLRLVTDAYVAQRRIARRATVFVDQINHERFLHADFLKRREAGRGESEDVLRPIVLIRRPEPALASMVEVLGEHYGFTLPQAIAYYQERVASLASMVADLPNGHCAWLAFEDLVATPEPILRGLERELALPAPALTTSYPTHRFTGGAGDPSKFIQRGTITPREPRELALPNHEARRLDHLYTTTRDLLTHRCRAVASS